MGFVETLESRQLLSSTLLDFNAITTGVGQSGFASVLPTSKGKGLIAQNLSIASGQLKITPTVGDMMGTNNNQDNALSIPIAAAANFEVRTRIISPGFKANWQSAGIFVGTNQDNYVKLVAGFNGKQVLQLASETGAVFTSVAMPALNFSGVSTLDLRLVGSASSKIVLAQYRVNSSSDTSWVTVGQVNNSSVFSNSAQAGVVTTCFATSPVVAAFDSFQTIEAATTTPTTPTTPTIPTSPALSVGANVNASKSIGNQVETEITINPMNPNNMVIIAGNQANNMANLMVSRSNDGGKTWTISSLGSAQDKLSGSTPRVDPHVMFDSFGNVYVTYMVAASSTEIRMIVAQSKDGGATFANVKAAVAGQGLTVDFPFIATGVSAANKAQQTIWIGYTDTKLKRVRMVSATSTGLGNLGTFSAPVTVADSSGSYGSAAVGPDGQVVVAWQTATGGQGPAKIYTDIDADGSVSAKTWVTDRLATSTNVGGFDYIPAQPDRSIYSNLQLAYDLAASSSTQGRLYLLYTDEPVDESSDTNIYLRYSDNNGSTWSTALKVNDDNRGKSQFLPAMSIDPVTGNVAIVWHDARNSSDNRSTQIYGTVSLDHGKTALASIKLSTGVSNQKYANGAGDDLDFGDYAGVAFNKGKFIAVWADTSNSTGDNPNSANSSMDLYTVVVTVKS